MSIFTATDRPDFDFSARLFSKLSLIGSVMTLVVFLMARGRGIDFGLHMLLIFMFFAQVAIFVLFVIIAVFIAGFRGGIQLTRIGSVLILIAIAGVAAQFFTVNHIQVNGSTVP